MKFCLITASTAAEFLDAEEVESESVRSTSSQPQLGVLSLAAVLEARGERVQVIDLNHAYFEYRSATSTLSFADFAAQFITESQPDIYGFSSICSSYPLTIRIAEKIKAARPDSTILLGGPQASV